MIHGSAPWSEPALFASTAPAIDVLVDAAFDVVVVFCREVDVVALGRVVMWVGAVVDAVGCEITCGCDGGGETGFVVVTSGGG